jgi:two-component system NtrC family response regulator
MNETDERPVLLIVDDDLGLHKRARGSLDRYRVVCAESREAALVQLRRHEPAVVALDLGLPPDPDTPAEGLRALDEILAILPATRVVALTGQGGNGAAVRALGQGACDCLPKPIEPGGLGPAIDRAFRLAEIEQARRRLEVPRGAMPLPGLLTRDPGMLRVARQIERLAPAAASVLLEGESGTGKEVLARALHTLSPRSTHRFVAINCAAIPDALLEAELFGHEKGAFTGALRTTPGRIETADGGTLFLDEVGDLPSALQAKLLRFLQERTFVRVGGREEIAVDVRVICATHRNLLERSREGGFREDLFYRLAETVVAIPPLRERSGDATLLAHDFVARFGTAHGRERMTLRADAIDAIEQHRWPGNVRELENCVKRAVIMAEDATIAPPDLGLLAAREPESLNLRHVRLQAERLAVVRAMARADGNIARAADLLGVSRPTLYDLLNRFGLR